MSNFDEKQAFCANCEKNVVAKRKGTNHILHLIMSIITVGLWLVIWILASVKFGGWYCSFCGSKKLKRAMQ